MKRFHAFVFILFASLCSLSAQISGSLSHGGLNRTYIVYLPSSYTQGSSLPLVLVLHALTMNGQRIMRVSGMNAVAEANNFIAVYPDGIGGSWNTGLPIPGASTADDVGFLEALIDKMVSLYNIDLNRVYSCGLSNGGFMSYKLACESSKCFAAVASVAGTITDAAFSTCAPTRPVPVMHIHGTADAIVPYGGTIGIMPVNDVLAYWLFSNNNCSGNPAVTALPNTSVFDFSTVDRFVWSPCDNGAEVQLLRVNGGGHQWPGTTVILGGLGNINRDINASQEIWNFFSRFTCNQSAANPIPPAPTATASPSIVCFGTSSTLTATSPGGNYEWFNTAIGGTPIATGATFTTPPLFVTTTYWVQTTIGTDVSARTAVVVTVDPNPQPLPPVVTALPATLCGSGTSVLASTVPVLGTISWYDAAAGGNLLGTGPLFTTPNLTATTTFWAEPVRGNCTGPRTPVTVTVSPLPAAPAASASPAVVCQGGVSTLTATGGSGTFSWFDAPAGGLLLWIGPSYTTLPLLNTTTYYVQETDASGCTSARTAVTVTVNPLPAAPTVTPSPAAICSGATATLTATAPGGTYDWFNVPFGGTPIATGASFTTPVLSGPAFYWVQTTDANGCVSPRTRVTVRVTPTPPAPSVIARPAAICAGSTSVLVSRNAFGVANWYDAPSGGNLLGSGRILVVNPAATATYYADVTIGGCTGPRASVTVTVNAAPAAPTVSAPSTICYGTSATMNATAPGGLYSWYLVPSGGVPVWIGAAFTTPPLFATTTYYVQTNSSGCVSPRTAVTVTVDSMVFPPKLTANPPTVCAGGSSTLSASVPAGTVDWYDVPFGGVPIASGLNYTTPPLTGRTTFWATVTVNGCVSDRASVDVKVVQVPAPLVTPVPFIVCSGFSSTLVVNFPLTGTINWYDAPSGGTFLGSGFTFTTLPVTATTTWYAEASMSGCTGTRTAATVILGPCKTGNDVAGAIGDESAENALVVYPNPTEGFITVDFSDNSASAVRLRIFDASGRIIYAEEKLYAAQKTEYHSTIDLSTYPKGVYLLQVIRNDSTLNRKVVVQ